MYIKSLCCMPKTNAMLYVNYISIKNSGAHNNTHFPPPISVIHIFFLLWFAWPEVYRDFQRTSLWFHLRCSSVFHSILSISFRCLYFEVLLSDTCTFRLVLSYCKLVLLSWSIPSLYLKIFLAFQSILLDINTAIPSSFWFIFEVYLFSFFYF